jgi:phosphate transport system protein
MEHRHFENALEELKHRLLVMGGLVEERVHQAVRALAERRPEMAAQVAAGDADVNALQIEIDDRCLKLLALQNPVGSDLRLITAAMKINDDLERIGDQAVNLAGYVAPLLRLPLLKRLIDIPRMAEIAERMTRDSLDAFVRRDAALARDVLTRDDEVDGLKDGIFRELLTYMMADPSTIERALGLILVSRSLERIADHATNIAEDVIFVVEAKDVRHRHEADETQADQVPRPNRGPAA